MIVLLVACTEPPGGNYAPGPPGPGPSDPLVTGSTGSTGSTGDTATEPPVDVDCDNLPSGEPLVIDRYNIETTEDFDFDALGHLVYSDWVNFVAVDINLDQSLVAPGIQDTRGIQILSDGNIAAAYITEGRLGYTDRLTGGSMTLLAGLQGPNALEVDDGDILYYSETGSNGRVSSFDKSTGATVQVAGGLSYPNGLALSHDRQRLFIGDSGSLGTNGQGLYMIERIAGGPWGQKQLLLSPDDAYDGIETDVCGNVYVVGFTNGRLNRFNPDTLETVLLVDLNDEGEFLWNAIRWGSGRGGWARDVLYVTDRNKIFGVHVGVPGRSQPVDLMP